MIKGNKEALIVLGIAIRITNKKFLENNNLKFVKSKGIEEFFMRICLSFIIYYIKGNRKQFRL